MIQKQVYGLVFAIVFCLFVASVASELQAQPPFGALPDQLRPPVEDVDDGRGRQPERIRPRSDLSAIRPFERPVDEENEPDQPVELNARYAGWEGAGIGSGADRLSDEIRGNWIMADPNGRFDGRVIPMDNAEIGQMTVFLMNKGRLVKQANVDADGMYEFTNVRQGAYALIGWSEGAFFAFGLNILSDTDDSNPNILNRVTTLAFQNRTTINTDWIKYFAPQVSYRVFGRYPTDEGPNDTEALYGFIGLVENQPSAAPATSISGHNVNKTPDGRVVGRIHQMTSETGRPVDVRSTKVLLLQNDDVYAATTTDNFGLFQFSDVAPGRYAVVAAGVDGAALVGINVVDGDTPLMNEDGELTPAGSFDTDLLFDVCMIPSETMGWLNHYATEVAYRRIVLAPRPKKNGVCKNCNGAGCSQCKDPSYLDGPCASRSITFNQWASQCRGPYCKDRASRPDGVVRRVVDGIDKTFEEAFYPDTGNGISGGPSPNGGGSGPNGGYRYNGYAQ